MKFVLSALCITQSNTAFVSKQTLHITLETWALYFGLFRHTEANLLKYKNVNLDEYKMTCDTLLEIEVSLPVKCHVIFL